MKFFMFVLTLSFLSACTKTETQDIKIKTKKEIISEIKKLPKPFVLEKKIVKKTSEKIIKKFEQKFKNIGLLTDTSIHEIPLNEVLGGGPHKDGIPAITNPKNWETITQAQKWIKDNHEGVLIEFNNITKFYPYDILYWHEIVNDHIGNNYFSVTFCPLCGSVLVFDRKINNQILTFGVSGKLWESNLLMYDKKTESLWSQILGKAVIGKRTGQKLNILEQSTLTFQTLKENFPNAQILSKRTGYNRPYGTSPYGDYETNKELMFPVKNDLNNFKKFHPKERFNIINIDPKTSVGFMREKLLETKKAEIIVRGKKITAEILPNGKTIFKINQRIFPSYVTMWFSWQTHQHSEKFIWPENS